MSKAKNADKVYPRATEKDTARATEKDTARATEKDAARATEKDAEAIDANLDGDEFQSCFPPFGAHLIREAHQEGFKKGLAEGKAVIMACIIYWRYAEFTQEILTQVRASVDKEFLERVGKAVATTNTV